MYDRLDLGITRDVLVDLLTHPRCGLTERGQRNIQAGVLADVLQQRLRGLRIGRLRQVMRHMHREAERFVPVLGHPVFQQRGGAARHLQLTRPALVLLDQIAIGRMRGDAEWAGVRNGHRDRAQADAAAHTELFGQQAHGRGELLPA